MPSPRDLPRDSDLLKKMRQRFTLADESEAEQSSREQKAIAFEDGQQWPAAIKASREGQDANALGNGVPAVPARPTLVIDKVKEPVRQILNQERQSDIGIQLTPADDFGDLGITPDPDEVFLREGLIRKIQRESHASDARSWAYKRAVIAGRGYYIVRNRFLPGKTWDQEVYTDKIYNQDGVRLDPSHTSSVGSDSEWGFIGTWCPWDRFLSEWQYDADGDSNLFADMDDKEFMGMSESYPDWYRTGDSEDGGKAIRIVDYWYVERESRELGVLETGEIVWVDEAPKGTTFADTRQVTEKVIKFCKIAGGCLELERTDEIGPFMPIIKMVGEEVLPYDEERRYKGIVEPAMDPQTAFNYMVSKMVEMVGLAPIPPLQLDPEAIDGFEAWYNVANTRALPWLPYRSRDDQGQSLAPPVRLPSGADIGAVVQGASLFDEMIKSTTAVPDSTLGNVDPSLKSGKAIQAVVANAAMSTSNYLDNYKRSMVYEAEIINGKLYPTYGIRPGRLARILTGEGEEQILAIGDPNDPQQKQRAEMLKAAKVAKLTKDANFNVIAKVTQNSENRRQQFVQMFGDLISADPQLMGVGGDLFFKHLDIPEARQLSERQKTMLLPPVQQMLAAKEAGGPAPNPQVQQMQQMVQQLQMQLQQATQGEQAKLAQIQSTEKIEQAKLQLEQWKTQFQAQIDMQLQQMKLQADMQTKGAELQQKQSEAVMDADTRRHDAMLRDKGNLRDTLSAVDSQAAEHAHQREQAQQQAAMQQTMQPPQGA